MDRIVQTMLNRTNKVKKHSEMWSLSNISIKSSRYVRRTDLSDGRKYRKKLVTKHNEICSFNKLGGGIPFPKKVYIMCYNCLKPT